MTFTLPEYQLLRAGLDSLTIRGADAKMLASLQIKLEKELERLANPPKQEELKK